MDATDALELAQNGFRVLPVYGLINGVCGCHKGSECPTPGKHPCTRNGYKDATYDEDTIRRWSTSWEEANLGISIEGFWVLDVEADGLAQLELLESSYGNLIAPRTKSGGGGQHLFFAGDRRIQHVIDKRFAHRLHADSLVQGLLVVPPSLHASGNRYEWIAQLCSPLPSAPEWLVDIVTSVDPVDGGNSVSSFVADDCLADHSGAHEGSRHATAKRLLGRAFARGISPATILEQAAAWANRCDPKFPLGELRKIFQWFVNREGQHDSRPGQITGKRLVTVNLGSVEKEEIRWLWQPRLALGKLSLLVGDPGISKSTLALDIAAKVTTGAAFPDQPECGGNPGSVVLLTAEDGLADTVRPRFEAACGNPAKVHVVQMVSNRLGDDEWSQWFSLRDDLDVLAAELESIPDCRLVIIDPLTAYLGKSDSHNNADIRSVLGPVSQLAEDKGICIVGISHLVKDDKRPTIYRTLGSLAFVAQARSVWMVEREAHAEHANGESEFEALQETRILRCIKNNLGDDRIAIRYTVDQHDELDQPVIDWESESFQYSPDQAPASGPGKNGSRLGEAKDFLQETLAGQAVPMREVAAQADESGISESTLNRRAKELGVVKHKNGGNGPWVWSLPADQEDQDDHTQNDGPLGVLPPDDGANGHQDDQDDQGNQGNQRVGASSQEDDLLEDEEVI